MDRILLKMSVTAVLLLAGAALVLNTPPARAEGPAGGGLMIEHEVQDGDNLHLLAGYYYKDPRQWRKIYRQNNELLPDPNLLSPGTTLKVKSEPDRQWRIPYGEFVSQVHD
jgi:nucleoid-associated protein YgaU